MQHCNSVFKAQDIWYLIDLEGMTKRKIFIANCPICNKEMALYEYFNEETKEFYQKYFYSGGARRIKEKFKKDVHSTMLNFKNKYKAPSGFKYGQNIEVKKKGKIVEVRQYACDFYGNRVLVKRIEGVNEQKRTSETEEKSWTKKTLS